MLHDGALSSLSLNHRMMCTLGDWLWQRRYQVVTFDLRGFGRSSRVDEFGTDYYQTCADDADAVLADLGLDDAAVIGIGDGGVVGLNLAIRHPHRVRALVADSARLKMTSATATGSPPFPTGTAADRCRELLDEMHGADYVEPMLSAYSILLRQLADQRADLYQDRLAEIDCPTLFLACENDGQGLDNDARALASRVSRSKLVVVHKSGKRVSWSAPARFRAAVGPFLDEHVTSVVAR
jgi:pimeloyl-ACP methyl ester carboxylesterase